jgi:hypothetical protein
MQRIAVRTSGWISAGEAHRLTPHEPSITDLNLFELKVLHPRRVFVWRVTTAEEKRIGADWEWYIGDDAGWYAMRVQAKRLDIRSQSYQQLRTGHGRMQAATLIANAGAMEAVYCFYNAAWPTNTRWSSCGPLIHPLAYGCTMAPAAQVQAARSNNLADLAPLSMPWSDLICCGPSSQRTAARVQSTLRAHGGGAGEILQSVPAYARQAVTEGLSGDDSRLAGLAGIVVIDGGAEPSF